LKYLVSQKNNHAGLERHTVKPKHIETPSTFLTLPQFIRYSLEKGKKSADISLVLVILPLNGLTNELG